MKTKTITSEEFKQGVKKSLDRRMSNKDTMFQIFSYEGKIINVPYPFTQCDFGNNPLEEIEVANRFNGESVKLPAFAVAIYDVIMGSEALQDDKTMRKGLDFFIKYFPKQYMVLLD